MHPNDAFAWTDSEAMLRFVRERAFAHVFTASDENLFVVHVPVTVSAGRVLFHVAKRNRIAEQIAGRRILISVAGRDAYQSANWYVSDNQVPTWHYETVEVEGNARRLTDEELVSLLDRLSEVFEKRHSQAQPWTRAKMAPGKFDAMTRAIIGFEVEPIAVRGTRKFNQHKNEEDLAATIEGQLGAGREDIVAAIREVSVHE